MSFSKNKAFKQETKPYLSGLRIAVDQRGFTLIELVTILVIVGIMAVFVAPRFFNTNVFQSRGFSDQVQTTLRYAQKEAIAQRRNVCVAMAAGTITLTIAAASGAGAACGPGLALPTGGNVLSAPSGSGITMTFTSAGFTFDGLGSTTAQTITVNGAPNSIVVEAQTGYVHSP